MEAKAEKLVVDLKVDNLVRRWWDDPGKREACEEWALDNLSGRQHAVFKERTVGARREQTDNKVGQTLSPREARAKGVAPAPANDLLEASPRVVAFPAGEPKPEPTAPLPEVPPRDVKAPQPGPLPWDVPGAGEPEPKAPEPKPAAPPESRALVPVAVGALAEFGGWEDRKCPNDPDGVIDFMNANHAVIENYGGKLMLLSFTPSEIDPEKLVPVFQAKSTFFDRYASCQVTEKITNAKFKIENEKVIAANAGEFWFSHRDRNAFAGITFIPGAPKVIRRSLNLYQGFGIEPKAGSWRLMQSHIREIWCAGNEVNYNYVLRWMAWAVQNPGLVAEVALVLVGPKGTGKNQGVLPLLMVFGQHGLMITNPKHIAGNFNKHLQYCCFLVCNEMCWSGDKAAVGALQTSITEPTLMIEPKGVDSFQSRNCLHMVMMAEDGWVVPVGQDERRYAVLKVSRARQQDHAYFKALSAETHGGGVEAMLADLLAMDLGDWHPRQLPDELRFGEGLAEQRRHSLSPLQEWWLGLLNEGRLPKVSGKRSESAGGAALLAMAQKSNPWIAKNISSQKLAEFLKEQGCTRDRIGQIWGWAFPPLRDCRADWERRNGSVEWESKAEAWNSGE